MTVGSTPAAVTNKANLSELSEAIAFMFPLLPGSGQVLCLSLGYVDE